MRVLVVQHGEKERTPGDPGLTAAGHAQASATARWLAAPGTGPAPLALRSSPLRRALETAAPIAAAPGLDVRVDDRLRERMNWDGAGGETLTAFLAEWRQATDDRSYLPRSGDSSTVAAVRFLGALGVLAGRHPSGTAVVVAHGGVTTDALRTVLGDREVRARAPTLIDEGLPSGAITTFEWSEEHRRWRVPAIAATDHLGRVL